MVKVEWGINYKAWMSRLRPHSLWNLISIGYPVGPNRQSLIQIVSFYRNSSIADPHIETLRGLYRNGRSCIVCARNTTYRYPTRCFHTVIYIVSAILHFPSHLSYNTIIKLMVYRYQSFKNWNTYF